MLNGSVLPGIIQQPCHYALYHVVWQQFQGRPGAIGVRGGGRRGAMAVEQLYRQPAQLAYGPRDQFLNEIIDIN